MNYVLLHITTAILPPLIKCIEYYRQATSKQVFLLHSRGLLGQPQFKLQTSQEFSKTSLITEQRRRV